MAGDFHEPDCHGALFPADGTPSENAGTAFCGAFPRSGYDWAESDDDLGPGLLPDVFLADGLCTCLCKLACRKDAPADGGEGGIRKRIVFALLAPSDDRILPWIPDPVFLPDLLCADRSGFFGCLVAKKRMAGRSSLCLLLCLLSSACRAVLPSVCGAYFQGISGKRSGAVGGERRKSMGAVLLFCRIAQRFRLWWRAVYPACALRGGRSSAVVDEAFSSSGNRREDNQRKKGLESRLRGSAFWNRRILSGGFQGGAVGLCTVEPVRDAGISPSFSTCDSVDR